MKKYILLYMMPAAAMQEMMATASPDEQQTGMDDWRAWMDRHRDHFADEGAPAGKNTRVSKTGATEVANDVAGYSIVTAPSREAVLEMVEDSPHLSMPEAYVEVMECVEMPA